MKFGNSAKTRFLDSIDLCALDNVDQRLTAHSKFSFAHFCTQPAGQDFHEWDHASLADLLEKLKGFNKEPLQYWLHQKHGKGTTLAIYRHFPKISDFSPPKHVPHDVQWARFRLSGKVRLIGFVISSEKSGKPHAATKIPYDCNTFYVVFLDREHRFWASEAN